MDPAAEGDDGQPEMGDRPGFAADTGEQPDNFDPGETRRDYQHGNRGPEQQGQGRDRHDRRDRFRPRWDKNRRRGPQIRAAMAISRISSLMRGEKSRKLSRSSSPRSRPLCKAPSRRLLRPRRAMA